jgi:uncharacterized membrane protein
MTPAVAHLWAVGYDDMGRADQVRAEITRLGAKRCLLVLNTAVVVRYADGSATLDGEAFVNATNLPKGGLARFLAGLALAAPPLTGAAAGTFLRATGTASPECGISEDFMSEVERLMKPGSSALFVLDEVGDLETVLQGIRGLGGAVLRTTVDVERAKLVQSTLSDSGFMNPPAEDRP